MPDSRARPAAFAALEATRFDVLVIGGGVTGAGIARDAALRGLSTALIEARDFASGTSSRSSKMIHGGLRYLAQGDIGLVREAASERINVRRIAPHLARITPFLMQVGSLAAITKMRAALWTFEKLGGVPAHEAHELWNAAQLAEREPLLRNENRGGAVVYPEFLTDDARLTLANIRAAEAAGAVVLNYCEAREILLENNRAVGVLAAATLPREANLGARIRARVVVNAAGPWVDAVRALEDKAAPKRLMLSKGIHIVLHRDRLKVRNTVILPAAGKRRIFAVPRGNFTYLGTTDTFYPTPDTWPRVTAEDIAYLFDASDAAFTTPKLAAADIVSVWSGVRPLIGQEGKSASDISRKDEVWDGPAGVISIAGGKLSAYRAMAERIVDKVADRLETKHPACTTATTLLPGGDAVPADVEAALIGKGLAPDEAQRLAGLYGAESTAFAAADDIVTTEVAIAVTREAACRLEDWWARRSARAWFSPGAGLPALPAAAAAMGALLGWTPTERDAEIENCRTINADSRAEFAALAREKAA
jgi:glycerol-3-phosphate dehydrogenase